MSLSYSIASIMRRLEDWALLPKYQLERRVDIFLTPFLEALVGQGLGARATLVVPEFPLRTIHRPASAKEEDSGAGDPEDDGKDTAHTVNVDYLLWVEPEGQPPYWVFLELKTDTGSFKPDQALLYAAARSLGMRRLRVDLDFVRERSKRQAPKYDRLIGRLDGFDREADRIVLLYLGPSGLETLAKEWTCASDQRPDGYLTLSGFADLPDDRIPSEHVELWPFVRDLLRTLDASTARPAGKQRKD